MQQHVVAPISSVHIANVGPQGAQQHTELISYISEYSKRVNVGGDTAIASKHRKKQSSNFQTINSVSVQNVE